MERPTRARKQPSRLVDFELGQDSGKERGRKVDAVNVGRGGRGGRGRGVAKRPSRPTALATTGAIGKSQQLYYICSD